MQIEVRDRVKLKLFNHSTEWHQLFENLTYSDAIKLLEEVRDHKRDIHNNKKKMGTAVKNEWEFPMNEGVVD